MFNISREIINDIKNKFNLELINSRIITGGYMNQKWRVLTNNGEYLLKLFSNKRYDYNKILTVERSLLKHYQLNELGFACPKIQVYNSKIIQEVNNVRYMLMDFVEGGLRDHSTINNAEMIDLGKTTAIMHSLLNSFPKTQVSFNVIEHRDKVRNDCINQLKQLCEFQESRLLPLVRKQKTIVESISDSFLHMIPIGYAHADYASDNILFLNNKVSAVVDFDRCRYTSKWQDIGRALISYTLNNGELDYNLIKSFVKGYNKILPLSYNESINTLRYIWLHEVRWWIKPENFENEVNSKVKRFRDEMVFLTNNYLNL